MKVCTLFSNTAEVLKEAPGALLKAKNPLQFAGIGVAVVGYGTAAVIKDLFLSEPVCQSPSGGNKYIGG